MLSDVINKLIPPKAEFAVVVAYDGSMRHALLDPSYSFAGGAKTATERLVAENGHFKYSIKTRSQDVDRDLTLASIYEALLGIVQGWSRGAPKETYGRLHQWFMNNGSRWRLQDKPEAAELLSKIIDFGATETDHMLMDETKTAQVYYALQAFRKQCEVKYSWLDDKEPYQRRGRRRRR